MSLDALLDPGSSRGSKNTKTTMIRVSHGRLHVSGLEVLEVNGASIFKLPAQWAAVGFSVSLNNVLVCF